MAKKKQKVLEQQVNHIFNIGDVVSNLSKSDIMVILKSENRTYTTMSLKKIEIKDIFGNPIIFEKGTEMIQDADKLERHYSYLEL
jgi:hypothetical protein